MLELLILLIVALGGYLGASGWLVALGAAGLTIDGWALKLKLLRQHPSVPFSSKMATYFITGVLANLGFAALSYLAGRLVRSWLG
jgi:hypothetical protein